MNRRNSCDTFLSRPFQIVLSLRFLTSTSNTLTFLFHYLHTLWSFFFLSWKLYDPQWRYHIWSDLSLRFVYFHIRIRILTTFTDSLYQEGDSYRNSLPSAENHIEFSALKLHCPVDSPPFHFPCQQFFQTLYWRPYTILSCNTSLLFGEAFFVHQPVCLILIDIPITSPLTPVTLWIDFTRSDFFTSVLLSRILSRQILSLLLCLEDLLDRKSVV